MQPSCPETCSNSSASASKVLGLQTLATMFCKILHVMCFHLFGRFLGFEVLGTEGRLSQMLDTCATTELHPPLSCHLTFCCTDVLPGLALSARRPFASKPKSEPCLQLPLLWALKTLSLQPTVCSFHLRTVTTQ